jgi:hypothetical protein
MVPLMLVRNRQPNPVMSGNSARPDGRGFRTLRDRRDSEEVHGHCRREVAVQKRAPRLRRWPPAATHVLADAGFSNVNAEFQQLTVDAWRSPQRVLSTHSSNQFTDVVRNGWASWPAVMALPRPERPEGVAMPRDDGCPA